METKWLIIGILALIIGAFALFAVIYAIIKRNNTDTPNCDKKRFIADSAEILAMGLFAIIAGIYILFM